MRKQLIFKKDNALHVGSLDDETKTSGLYLKKVVYYRPPRNRAQMASDVNCSIKPCNHYYQESYATLNLALLSFMFVVLGWISGLRSTLLNSWVPTHSRLVREVHGRIRPETDIPPEMLPALG